MGEMGLITGDFCLSVMWAWAGALSKLFVYSYLEMGHTSEAEALKLSLSLLYMYVFAWLGILSNGATYNPLNVLPLAFSGHFLLTAFGRIPAQIAGSIVGVKLLKKIFPQVGSGASLNVDISHGALTEGLLTFVIVMVTLGLKKNDPKSFFMKTWISSISKMSLHILGSDLTGGIMNPAAATGWAFARGDHLTTEHLLVYWAAPFLAAILAVWVFNVFTKPSKNKVAQQNEDEKIKSE